MRKSIILIVCLSILTALFTHLSPISYAEDSTAILYDGTAQSFLLLNENETEVLSLSKTADVDASYQWEILIDEENGAWVELENQNDDQYEVVYQTLRDLTGEEDNTVQLRCRVIANEEVSYSNVLDIELFENVFVTNNMVGTSDDAETTNEDEYAVELIEDELVEGEEPEEEETVLDPDWMTWSSYDDFLAYQDASIAWVNPEFYIGLTAVFNTYFWNNFQLTDDPENERYVPTASSNFIFQTSTQVKGVNNSDDKAIDGDEELALVEGLKVVVSDVYFSELDEGLLWFKVSAAEGYTLPEELEKYPWVLQSYIPEDPVSLSMLPIEGTFLGDSIYLQNQIGGATAGVMLSVSELPVYFDVLSREKDDFLSEYYDLGDVTSWSSSIPSAKYRYVYDDYVILVPVEVTIAYKTLMSATSSGEYSSIYESIPESVLNMFTQQQIQNAESYSEQLIRIENVEVESTVTIGETPVEVKVKGKIPETAILSVTPVTNETVLSEGFNIEAENIVLALDIKVYNEGVEWQPEEGLPVDLMIDMESLGYEDGTVFELHHKHGDRIDTYEVFVVMDGMLTIRTDGFSIYVANSVGSTATSGNNLNGRTVTLTLGQDPVVYYNSNTGSGTWRVVDPDGALYYTVHASGTPDNSGIRACWLRIIPLKLTGDGLVTVTYQYGNNSETFYIKVVYPEAPAGKNALVIKDEVNTTGRITATLVNDKGQEDEALLAGAAFEWTRDDGWFIVPTAYELENRSVNIARDHGGLVEARKDSSGQFKPITYTVKATLANGEELEAEYTVYYQSEIINASFEMPDKGTNYGYSFFPNGWPDLYWKTTGVGTGGNVSRDIEYININNNGNTTIDGTTFGPRNAREGTQLAELNAEAFGTLYQDIITAPGEYIEWEFSHASRVNQNNSTVSNKMFIVIGPTEYAQKLTTQDDLNRLAAEVRKSQENVTKLENGETVTVNFDGAQYAVRYHDAKSYNSNSYPTNNAWTDLSGSYKVPEGQYRTRIFFMTDSPNNNTQNYGNLIDAAKAGQYKSYLVEYYLETYKDGARKFEHLETFDQSGEALVYSTVELSSYEQLILEPYGYYLHQIYINGSNYPYSIRYGNVASLYIENYPEDEDSPLEDPFASTGEPYEDYQIVMQIYLRDTVIAVEKVLEFPSTMTTEQKLNVIETLVDEGDGYVTNFKLTSTTIVDFGEVFKEAVITKRDPDGGYTAYISIGDKLSTNGDNYVIEEIGPHSDEYPDKVMTDIPGLVLNEVVLETTRYSYGVGQKLDQESYLVQHIYDEEADIKTKPFELNSKAKIAEVVVTNKYVEKMTTVYYKAIGKGKVKLADSDVFEDMPSEQLAYYSGKAHGGSVHAGSGATFVGWFKDPSCSEASKVTVADGVIDPVTGIFKPNANIINAEEITFYAKFETGSILIEKTNCTDLDQIFVYHITNNETDSAKKIDMYVTLTADKNGVFKKEILEIPDGTYTVTEVTDWGWRYPSKEYKNVSYVFKTDGQKVFTFDEPKLSDKDKWLNGFDLLKNLYGQMTGGGS